MAARVLISLGMGDIGINAVYAISPRASRESAYPHRHLLAATSEASNIILLGAPIGLGGPSDALCVSLTVRRRVPSVGHGARWA